MRFLFLLLLPLGWAACTPPPPATTPETGWVSLFNGTDLSGWEVLGGPATFYVEDSAIVGLTEDSLPNCFLATQAQYADFILEAEFMIDSGINSGIQLRSAQYLRDTTTPYLSGQLEMRTETWEAGRVYGYQIEIDPSDRAWTGGFYEEGGRGWLQPLTHKPEARAAFQPGAWNQFRIQAAGSHFQSWVNGVPAADTIDTARATGFIALQLHGAWRPDQVGQKVRFRNLRLQPLPAAQP